MPGPPLSAHLEPFLDQFERGEADVDVDRMIQTLFLHLEPGDDLYPGAKDRARAAVEHVTTILNDTKLIMKGIFEEKGLLGEATEYALDNGLVQLTVMMAQYFRRALYYQGPVERLERLMSCVQSYWKAKWEVIIEANAKVNKVMSQKEGY